MDLNSFKLTNIFIDSVRFFFNEVYYFIAPFCFIFFLDHNKLFSTNNGLPIQTLVF